MYKRQHYGGTVVALTIDEEGIPATADGRMAIARKICAEAEKYGIQKKDIVIDALCMTTVSYTHLDVYKRQES